MSNQSTKSIELYKELLEMSDDIREFTEDLDTHESFLDFNELNRSVYNTLQKYDSVVEPEVLFEDVDDWEYTYKSSKGFYLNQRNESIKSADLQLGRKFTNKFIKFLRKKGYNADRGDEEKAKYPDILLTSDDGEKIAYIEFKYLHAPFLMVDKYIDGRYWYEGSTTLDYEKAKKQMEIIEEEIDVPVYYTYWIDFPGVKGIFSMQADEVAELLDEEGYDRKDREGDYEVVGEAKTKVGYTKKVYLPLLQMIEFETLLEELEKMGAK